MRPRGLHAISVLIAIAVIVAMTSACGVMGPKRSVSSYCNYFYGQGSKLRNQWLDANANAHTDPLTALGALLGAPAQLATFFHHLAQRAPDDISDDVETLSTSFQKTADSEGDNLNDPMTAIAKGLINGLSSVGAFNRVNTYTEQNCGPPPTK